MSIYRNLYKKFEGSGIGNLKIIVLLRRLYLKPKIRRPIKINGYKLWLDRNDSLNIILNGTHEPQTLDYLMKHAKGIGLDLGANIGLHTIAMAQRCERVYSIEPLKSNFNLLTRNIKLNNLYNVHAFNLAVGASNGKKRIYSNIRGNGSASFLSQGKWNGKEEEVKIVRLDDLFKDKPKPNIIKMDIEGWEEEAIRGGIEIFKHAETVIFEDNQEILRKKGKPKDAVIKLMENIGFVMQKKLDGNYLAIRKRRK